jgi:hypothetical protein
MLPIILIHEITKGIELYWNPFGSIVATFESTPMQLYVVFDAAIVATQKMYIAATQLSQT